MIVLLTPVAKANVFAREVGSPVLEATTSAASVRTILTSTRVPTKDAVSFVTTNDSPYDYNFR